MNEFQKRYKSFDNRKLLKIIEEAENYQPTAVEAAILELSKREIGDEEKQSVKGEILERKTKIEQRQKQVKIVENKTKEIGTELFETISLIQKERQTIDRKIKLIVIVFGLLAIYQIFKKFGMLQFMFVDNLAEWDFSLVIYFLPMILLPIGVFLFWKRNKIGWILMSAFFVYNIVNAIGMFFLTWEWNSEKGFTNDFSTGDYQIEFQEFESLFPQPNPIVYVLIIAIFGATLWVFSKEDLRNEFQIDIKSALITVGVSILITSILMGLIL